MTAIERASKVAKSILRPQLREDQWRRLLTATFGTQERATFEMLCVQFAEAERAGSGNRFPMMKQSMIDKFYDEIKEEFYGEKQ